MLADCLSRQPQERPTALECLGIIELTPLALAIEHPQSPRGIELLSPDFSPSSPPPPSACAPIPSKADRGLNVSEDLALSFGEEVPGKMEHAPSRGQPSEPCFIVIEDDEEDTAEETFPFDGEKVPGKMEQASPRGQPREPCFIVIEDHEDDTVEETFPFDLPPISGDGVVDRIILSEEDEEASEEEAVPFDRPPILSVGVAHRSRLQDPSMPHLRSYDGLGSATPSRNLVNPTVAEVERDRDSAEDAVEDDRPRKRIRAAVDPPILSSSAAPNVARPGRALVSESPDALHPQFALSYPGIHSRYPRPDGSTYPPPAFRTPATQNDRAQQIRQRTIARTVATSTSQDEPAYQAKVSYGGPSYSY
ncbi:hypothetical protein FRC00_002785 [Tulasnella sp. 408]|nr:hypothetical protein FRC00_002785 [Tulasnella sp. 408]